MVVDPAPIAVQAGLAAVYYLGVIAIVRLAGKRLAGQVTTFDLIVLIGLGVVLQTALLREGAGNAITFVVTVLACHKLLAVLCFRSSTVREWVRGKPRVLVREGQVIEGALRAESISRDELQAGLRKLGHDGPAAVQLATLEETGEISVVADDKA